MRSAVVPSRTGKDRRKTGSFLDRQQIQTDNVIHVPGINQYTDWLIGLLPFTGSACHGSVGIALCAAFLPVDPASNPDIKPEVVILNRRYGIVTKPINVIAAFTLL